MFKNIIKSLFFVLCFVFFAAEGTNYPPKNTDAINKCCMYMEETAKICEFIYDNADFLCSLDKQETGSVNLKKMLEQFQEMINKSSVARLELCRERCLRHVRDSNHYALFTQKSVKTIDGYINKFKTFTNCLMNQKVITPRELRENMLNWEKLNEECLEFFEKENAYLLLSTLALKLALAE
ncbi:MAG: hypothetical protein LBT70_02875 [Holosporaceae bacterium]|nr:hypothetical protein [Holosporaceae bacterium]